MTGRIAGVVEGAVASILAFGLLTHGASAASGPRDPDELESFLDGALPALLASHDVPGAVVSVVADGRTLLQKGYGWADLETRRPMDGRRTILRVASISKLVTATAAMRLVAAGKLDLSQDVNEMLEGFRVEPAFGVPITLHQLLTHTAGFDDRFLHTGRPLGAALPALGDYLAARMPPQVMPPGRVVSYSNHGLALVGHLVERASGQDFVDYVQEHVFDPLEMRDSRFYLEVPVSPDVAVPYVGRGDERRSLGYDHSLLGPAAELNTTAADMARFMLAHLGQGEMRLLEPATEARMQARQFGVHPGVEGWAYGFAETLVNGTRGVGHGGSWRGFESSLQLFPELGFGVFISANASFDAPSFYRAFWQVFADHYLPRPAPPRLAPAPDFGGRAARYTGMYLPNRRIRGDFMKLGGLLQWMAVRANDAGGLTVVSAGDGPTFRLVEIEPDLFRFEDGERYAHFFVEPDTGTEHLVLGGYLTLDRVSWWRSPRLHAVAGALALVFLAATLAGWGLGLGARRLASGAPSPVRPGVRLLAASVAALYLLGFGLVARDLRLDAIFDLMIEVPLGLRLAFAALTVASVASVTAPAWVWRGIVPGAHAPLARLHLWGLAAACLLLAALTVHWQLFAAWLD